MPEKALAGDGENTNVNYTLGNNYGKLSWIEHNFTQNSYQWNFEAYIQSFEHP